MDCRPTVDEASFECTLTGCMAQRIWIVTCHDMISYSNTAVHWRQKVRHLTSMICLYRDDTYSRLSAGAWVRCSYCEVSFIVHIFSFRMFHLSRLSSLVRSLSKLIGMTYWTDDNISDEMATRFTVSSIYWFSLMYSRILCSKKLLMGYFGRTLYILTQINLQRPLVSK